jgi:hypothetical protein
VSVEDRGKRPYEPPAVRSLGAVESGEGIPQCATGSGNAGNCVTGNVAGVNCAPTGNSAAYSCGSGFDGGA